jgi:hypothetical protein
LMVVVAAKAGVGVSPIVVIMAKTITTTTLPANTRRCLVPRSRPLSPAWGARQQSFGAVFSFGHDRMRPPSLQSVEAQIAIRSGSAAKLASLHHVSVLRAFGFVPVGSRVSLITGYAGDPPSHFGGTPSTGKSGIVDECHAYSVRSSPNGHLPS